MGVSGKVAELAQDAASVAGKMLADLGVGSERSSGGDEASGVPPAQQPPRVLASARGAESAPPAAPADCLPCRLVGTATCLGASAYLYLQAQAVRPGATGHRRLGLAFAGAFAAVGVTRALL